MGLEGSWKKFPENITPVLSDCLSTDPFEFRMGTGQFLKPGSERGAPIAGFLVQVQAMKRFTSIYHNMKSS